MWVIYYLEPTSAPQPLMKDNVVLLRKHSFKATYISATLENLKQVLPNSFIDTSDIYNCYGLWWYQLPMEIKFTCLSKSKFTHLTFQFLPSLSRKSSKIECVCLILLAHIPTNKLRPIRSFKLRVVQIWFEAAAIIFRMRCFNFGLFYERLFTMPSALCAPFPKLAV